MIEGTATAACTVKAREMDGTSVRKKGLRKLLKCRRELRRVMISWRYLRPYKDCL